MFKDGITTKVDVLEAIVYTDVEQIDERQTYDHLDGWFPVYVQEIEESNVPKEIIRGLNISATSKLIATQHDYEFKRGDIIRFDGHEKYKVKTVKKTIDPNYTKIVRIFPNAKRKYLWKIIELGR